MALRGALTHRKTRKLARLLGIDPCFALGIMEGVWHTTATQTPNGAIGRISNEDLADQIGYSGDPDKLIEALVEATLFDEDRLHRFIVHNWHLKSDDAVDAQLYRRGVRYANGSRPRGTKLGEKEKAKYAHLWPQPAESLFDQQPDPSVDGAPIGQISVVEPVVSITAAAAPRSAAQRLPEPEPVPEPVPVPASTPTPPLSRREAKRALELRIAKARETSPGRALDAAAQQVLSACSITGLKAVSMHTVIWCAIDGECQRVKKPPEDHAMDVAEIMARNHAQYVADGDLMRFHWGIRAFFEDGHWRNWNSWPIDRKAAEERERSRVGGYLN